MRREENILRQWIFNYDPAAKLYAGVHRDHMKDLFNDYGSKNIIRSSSVETLIEIILKIDGDITKLMRIA